MEQVLSKVGLKKLGVFLSFVFLLSACSPKLDWRTVQSPQEGYSAQFPGKPEKIERRLPYQNQEIPQTLEAVKIDNDIYSVSTIHLSKDQAMLAPKLLEQLQGNLLSRAGVNAKTVISADAFYQAMDLFLFTSRGTNNDKETMPLVIREAVSYQIPILIYNLPVYLNYWDNYKVEYLDFTDFSYNLSLIEF